MCVTSIAESVAPHNSLVKSFFETKGRTAGVSARLYFNKLVYGFIRHTRRTPDQGWIRSRWYWFHYPLSLRGETLWSEPLHAWFCPEDETALEYMLHIRNYEPVQWVKPREGDVFIDVGGHVGSYSISAARAVGPTGRVVTLEPDATNRRQLERNLALNGITNCQVLPVAAWSSSGSIGWHQDSHPVFHKVEKSEHGQRMEAVRIDDLVQRFALERVDWIKMDIEGGEVDALEGAAETLARFRPQLFIEIHETLQPVTEILSRFNYSIVDSTFDQPPQHHGWILARVS